MTEHMHELRPVVIDGHQEHFMGYFHAWAGLSEYPKAIIETPDGSIRIVDAHQVTFILEGKDE